MAADQDTGSANSSPPGSTASTESRRPKKDRRHTTQSHKSGTGQSMGTHLGAQSSLQRSHSTSHSYEFAGRHSPFEGADSDAEEPWLDEYQSPDLSTLNGFAFNSPPLGSNSYPAALLRADCRLQLFTDATSYGISADPQATAGSGHLRGRAPVSAAAVSSGKSQSIYDDCHSGAEPGSLQPQHPRDLIRL